MEYQVDLSSNKIELNINKVKNYRIRGFISSIKSILLGILFIGVSYYQFGTAIYGLLVILVFFTVTLISINDFIKEEKIVLKQLIINKNRIKIQYFNREELMELNQPLKEIYFIPKKHIIQFLFTNGEEFTIQPNSYWCIYDILQVNTWLEDNLTIYYKRDDDEN